jgi:hypothetical protein
MNNRHSYRAAWLPRPLPTGQPRLRNEVTVDWLLDQSAQLDVDFLCVSPSIDPMRTTGVSEYFRQVWMHRRVDEYRLRPKDSARFSVLAFVDSEVALAVSESWANGGALVAMSVGSFDLSAWADQHEALNLLG